MTRRNILALMAVVLTAVAAAPAFAGGSGGGGGSIPVRMKNVGAQAVGVNALSGNVAPSALLNGGRSLAANGIAQFMVKPGSFTAGAANPNTPQTVNKVRNFDTRIYKVIYLQAQQDGKTATLVGAPAGVKF